MGIKYKELYKVKYIIILAKLFNILNTNNNNFRGFF